MLAETLGILGQTVDGSTGFIYPNEQEITWGLSIVIYPYIAGLAAGSFLLASLVKILRAKTLEPVYRLSLLVSLAFLVVTPWPLLFHLGQPSRGIQVLSTPHFSSPMAVFGFVYVWLLIAVVSACWLEYRKQFVEWSKAYTGIARFIYGLLTLGASDVSDKAISLDIRLRKIIYILGIPTALILPGYVGFIFVAMEGNPLWGNLLLPVIFVVSSIVSGIALCLLLYVILGRLRARSWDKPCLDRMGRLLFYSLLVATCIEAFDWFHRISGEGVAESISRELAQGQLFMPLNLIQGLFGSLLPLTLLGLAGRMSRFRLPLYSIGSVLILIGVLAMRWNVVIGGQLISKSLRGFTSYTVELAGSEGLLVSVASLILPFLILWLLIQLCLPGNSLQTSVR